MPHAVVRWREQKKKLYKKILIIYGDYSIPSSTFHSPVLGQQLFWLTPHKEPGHQGKREENDDPHIHCIMKA
jgi:hypothetical protein